MIRPTPPPRSEAELLERAHDIAGSTVGELAAARGEDVPKRLLNAKGWTGQLIEATLGATAASAPEPDFQLIGVELKTIPVRVNGRPTESTYVCIVPLIDEAIPRWETSNVRGKLARVLWLPVLAHAKTPIAERRLGTPLLWSPSTDEEAALRADWEELMDMVCLGELESITAHHGTYLQIRPKAANASARRWGVGASGEHVRTLPRGFYLRAGFTEAVLRRHYVIG